MVRSPKDTIKIRRLRVGGRGTVRASVLQHGGAETHRYVVLSVPALNTARITLSHDYLPDADALVEGDPVDIGVTITRLDEAKVVQNTPVSVSVDGYPLARVRFRAGAIDPA